MAKPKLFIRADGNGTMGLGHLFRSLALAEMLKDQFTCTFLVRSPISLPESQFTAVCDALIELPATEDHISEAQHIAETYIQDGDMIVMDGYHFHTEYQKTLRDAGAKVVCIDDLRNQHIVADVIINHAGGVKPSDYSHESYTQCLLGMQYALLRPPFIQATTLPPNPEAKGVFICMGGADPHACTLPISTLCLELFPELPLQIVIGAAYGQEEDLEELAAQNPNVSIHQSLSAAEMVSLMRTCSLAICPASTVSLEALAAGVPLIAGMSAANQQDLYAGHLSHKTALGVGWFKDISFPLLRQHIQTFLASDSLAIGEFHQARKEIFQQSPASILRQVCRRRTA